MTAIDFFVWALFIFILYKFHTGDVRENRAELLRILASKFTTRSSILLLKRNEINIKEAMIDLELEYKKEVAEISVAPDWMYKNKIFFFIISLILSLVIYDFTVNGIIRKYRLGNQEERRQNLSTSHDDLSQRKETNKKQKKNNQKSDDGWLPFN